MLYSSQFLLFHIYSFIIPSLIACAIMFLLGELQLLIHDIIGSLGKLVISVGPDVWY
jgi:hypothetical protein